MPNIIKPHRTKFALLVGVAILLAILVIVIIQANRPHPANPQTTTTFAPTTTIAPDNTTASLTVTTTAPTTTESVTTELSTEETTEPTTEPAETEPVITTLPTTGPTPTAPPTTNPPLTEPPATTPFQTEPGQDNSTGANNSQNGSSDADNSDETVATNPTNGNIGNYVGPADPYTGLSWDGVSPIIYTYPDGTTGTEPMVGATYERKPGVIIAYTGSGLGSIETSPPTNIFYCEHCGKTCGDGADGTCVRWLVDGEHTCTNCGATVPAHVCHTCELN